MNRTQYVVLNIFCDVDHTIELITYDLKEAQDKLAQVRQEILEAEGHDQDGDTLEEAWEYHLEGEYDGYATILSFPE